MTDIRDALDVTSEQCLGFAEIARSRNDVEAVRYWENRMNLEQLAIDLAENDMFGTTYEHEGEFYFMAIDASQD